MDDVCMSAVVGSVEIGDVSDSFLTEWADDNYEVGCVEYMVYLFGNRPSNDEVAWDVLCKAMKRDYYLKEDYLNWIRDFHASEVLAEYAVRFEEEE